MIDLLRRAKQSLSVFAQCLCAAWGLLLCPSVWADPTNPSEECEFRDPPSDAPLPGSEEEDTCRIDVQGPIEGGGIDRTNLVSLTVKNDFKLQVCTDWTSGPQGGSDAPSVSFAQMRISRPDSNKEHLLVVSLVPTIARPALVFDWFSHIKGTWSIQDASHALPISPSAVLPTQYCHGGDASLASIYRFVVDDNSLNVYRDRNLVFRGALNEFNSTDLSSPSVTELLVDDLRLDRMPSTEVVRTLWRWPN